MSLPKRVRIVEVGARDGLQNEKVSLAADVRARFIDMLCDAGLKSLEVGSFVRADRVPQMAETDKVFSLVNLAPNVAYSALVPNVKGFEAALASGVKEIAIFASASEAFSQKNINCTIEESLNRFDDFASKALDSGMRIRGYVSCIAGCPYQGEVDTNSVLQVSLGLLDRGCYEVSLGDTIGVATPGKINALLDDLLPHIPAERLALHCHDTYGQALANIYAGLEKGISVVDCSIAGLGGCPYAKGASGNVATEDVLYMLNGLGIDTGVDLQKLFEAGEYILDKLGKKSNSKVAQANGY